MPLTRSAPRVKTYRFTGASVPLHVHISISIITMVIALAVLQAPPNGPLSSSLVTVTTQPSVSPSVSPTLSPTPVFCLPALVTCCFTVLDEVREIFIGDRNYTDHVYPVGFNVNRSVVKFVQFYEPPQNRSVIAIRGSWTSFHPGHGVLALSCHSSKPESPWNSLRSRGILGWRAIANGIEANLPAGWWSSDFVGTTYAVQNYTVETVPIFLPNITAYPELCGAYNASNRIRSQQTGRHFVFRINVTQPLPVCWTAEPTRAPTLAPTHYPTTSTPTLSPTRSPTVSAPTLSPTTQAPTRSPTTPAPTRSPICSPPLADIVIVLDASSSMGDGLIGLIGYANKFEAVRAALLAFVQHANIVDVRYALVQFAGLSFRNGVTSFQSFYELVDLTGDTAAFSQTLQNMPVGGGTTNTSGALDYVSSVTLRSETSRAGRTPYVMLFTDGYPTDITGTQTVQATEAAEASAAALKTAHPDAKFIFFRIENDYPANFMEASADYVFTTTFNTIAQTITELPLCTI